MPTYSDDRIVPARESEYEGLTKREYFAALAMQGLAPIGVGTFSWDPNNIAAMAVKNADALIEELNKEKK